MTNIYRSVDGRIIRLSMHINWHLVCISLDLLRFLLYLISIYVLKRSEINELSKQFMCAKWCLFYSNIDPLHWLKSILNWNDEKCTINRKATSTENCSMRNINCGSFEIQKKVMNYCDHNKKMIGHQSILMFRPNKKRDRRRRKKRIVMNNQYLANVQMNQ